MTGQKFSQNKPEWFTVLFKQFPLAIEEIIRCSQAGHQKYIDTDTDWQNFSRVPNAKNQYLNASLRHLKESQTQEFNEDMTEYDDKIRHSSQFVWNAIAFLELEMREKHDSQVNRNPHSNSKIWVDIKTLGYDPHFVLYSDPAQLEDKKLEFNDRKYGYKVVKDSPNQEKLPNWLIKAMTNECEGKTDEKGNWYHYFQRPTLSVDQLLDQGDSDYNIRIHPDSNVQNNLDYNIGMHSDYNDFSENTEH